MMLKELEAQFLKITSDNTYEYVNTLAEAQGIMFLCPACFTKNKGSKGTHSIICWFRNRNVPDHLSPGPGRWTPSGNGLDDLTFVPGNPPLAVSVAIKCWHGHVINGNAN